jgi:hypothetical protein
LIAFGSACDLNPRLDHAEFFSQVQWDPAAPKALTRSARTGDWRQFIERIGTPAAGRQSRGTSRDAMPVKASLWSLHDLECPPQASRMVAAWQAFGQRGSASPKSARRATNGRVGRGRKQADGSHELAAAVEEWLESPFDNRPVSQLEFLIAFEIQRDAANHFPVELGARLYRTLVALSIAHLKPVAPMSGTQDAGPSALDAELAWQAGLLFGPIAGAVQLRDHGRDRLWQLLEASSDAKGVPAADSLRDLPAWTVSIVRARDWGSRLQRPLFNVSREKRVRGLVEAVARLCRTDGRPALVRGETNGLTDILSTAVVSFPARVQNSSPEVRYLRSLGREQKNGRVATTGRNGSARKWLLPRESSPPVFQSDESRLACLRSDWSPGASLIVVSHSGRFPALEMSIGGRTLFAGDWELEARIDGRPVNPGAWTCSCWNSDEEGDYLELQARTEDVCIERQIFLSRKDSFALFADAVLSGSDARIESVCRLPLSGECATLAQSGSREYRLRFPGSLVRVFPLALNGPRVQSAAGQLTTCETHLELVQNGIGPVFAPLVLDWNPRRRRSPAAWRRLTVAQNGTPVLPSRAAGYLLENGPAKWLIYRSLLSSIEPRSVLGQHTMYETMVGRFAKGDVEQMVLVEQSTKKDA